MCKTVLTGSPEGQAIGEQFNRAILLMLMAPYAIFGVFTIALFRPRIRARLSALRTHGRPR